MKCVDCDTDLQSGAVFCGACGASQIAEPITKPQTAQVPASPDEVGPIPETVRAASRKVLADEQPAITAATPAEVSSVPPSESSKSKSTPIVVGAVLAVILAGAGFWGWSQKHSAEVAATAAAAQLAEAAQRERAETEVQRRITTAADQARAEAEAKAKKEMELQIAEMAAKAAAATPAASVPEGTVAPMASASPVETNDCATVDTCATSMMAAVLPYRADLISAVADRIVAMPKPEKGDRKSARELNKRALDSMAAKDFSTASTLFAEAASKDPRDVEVASNLGLAYVRANRPEPAIQALLKALLLEPRRSSAWAPMAEAFDLMGRVDLSEKCLLLALEFSASKEKSIDYFKDRSENADRESLRATFGKALRVAQAGH